MSDSTERVEKTKDAIKAVKHIGVFPDAEKANDKHAI